PTQIFSGRTPRRTSSLVSASPDIPLVRAAKRSAAASSQPVRLGRPVVAPNSSPTLRRCSPVASLSSVGNGPPPTRVVYTLEMPTTASMAVGPMPSPVQAPPATVLDDVTNG